MDSEGNFRLSDCEPLEWHVVFHRKSTRWWINRFVWGRYKHVSAFAEYRKAGTWLFFDVMVSRIRVLVVPDADADALMGHYADQGCVVRMMAPIPADDGLKLKPGFWCVPATAHLLGLRTCALRPDALLRHCLANGGRIVVEDDVSRAEGRP